MCTRSTRMLAVGLAAWCCASSVATVGAVPPAPRAPGPGTVVVPHHASPARQPHAQAGITRLGASRVSVATRLIGEMFAADLAGLRWEPGLAFELPAREYTALWEQFLEVDRELRVNEDATLDRMNVQAMERVHQPDAPDRDAVISRFRMTQSATSRAQLARMRGALNELVAHAQSKQADEGRIATALQHAQALLALQQGWNLVDGGGLPAADCDLFTTITEIIEARRARPGSPAHDATEALLQAMRNYVLAVGPLQFRRLEAATAVGARGTEPGRITAPVADERRVVAPAWDVHAANVQWLPRLLDAMPADLRAEVEPVLLVSVAPAHFPDHGCMRAVLRQRAQAPMPTAEGNRELKVLCEWFDEVYAHACRAILHASSVECESLFGPSRAGRPTRSEAQKLLEEALRQRADANLRAEAWLAALDPAIDMAAAREMMDNEAWTLIGRVAAAKAGRRPVVGQTPDQ